MAKIPKTNILSKFGVHLLYLRKVQKLSYRKMAQMCDVDHSDIKKYEKGKTNLSLTVIEQLAKGLSIEVHELLNFDFKFDESRLNELISINNIRAKRTKKL